MWKLISLFLSSCIALASLCASENDPAKASTVSAFSPFTGKVTKNKVRMRLQPNLDSAILRELSRDDLLVVASETDDFYGVFAPTDIKAYVYRTFILDSVVEGTHVNVRLEPNLDAPVIAQLNAGEHVDGVICPINSKWLEIAPPKTTEFYVAKDFVEKIGGPELLNTIHKRRQAIDQLLGTSKDLSESELEKPYQNIQLNTVFSHLDQIIHDKNSTSGQIEKAKAMLALVQDEYLKKKIAFIKEKPEKVAHTQSQVLSNENIHLQKTVAMNLWIPHEEKIYQSWATDHENQSYRDFYQQQTEEAISLSGIVEAFDRSIKNKPGDYVLINPENHLPIAYLYSTKVNLQNLLGQEINLKAVARPNNSFAFPAYFVLFKE